ncbi:glycosyltransferase family 4 protein [Gemmata sp. JC717]|uniref:Glycosyltransferase family 4 protein n=1 Tax=Gemmata algarum TaxID=2975278 RepID=A0ABU5EW40_9BACT|nr:glycosyltransferase family 4 protein [Gemmata algarum]MDY3551868.1 glycosyltransferase family 4 protein [Gemmata algarum]MDY3557834.1 glycosyltransferase family 4 protein [Gemmata algarum]
MSDRPHAVLLYHYFHPDDVVSARMFTDLADGLVARGWDVTAIPCNRGCREESIAHPLNETHDGVSIRRVWRPPFRQASARGRVLNAAWMLCAWARAAVTLPRRRNEVMIVGTDPVLGVLAALPWWALRWRAGIVHWCHDLYPDAAVAEGMLKAGSLPVRVLNWLLAKAYRRCGVIADLGPCMRERLERYGSHARPATLTPWALVEPSRPVEADPATRRELFGTAALGLLYSGSFGRAHSHTEFLDLARLLRGAPVGLCFAVRGNRVNELKAAVTPDDANVSFAGFAPEEELERRLGACDLHLVSLRSEWSGAVVPSKFFGALAAGRGVVYAGPPDSAIGRWVTEYRVGWVLTPETLGAVAADLRALAAEPGRLAALRARCHAAYHEHFSRDRQLDEWDAELRALLPVPAPQPAMARSS